MEVRVVCVPNPFEARLPVIQVALGACLRLTTCLPILFTGLPKVAARWLQRFMLTTPYFRTDSCAKAVTAIANSAAVASRREFTLQILDQLVQGLGCGIDFLGDFEAVPFLDMGIDCIS